MYRTVVLLKYNIMILHYNIKSNKDRTMLCIRKTVQSFVVLLRLVLDPCAASCGAISRLPILPRLGLTKFLFFARKSVCSASAVQLPCKVQCYTVPILYCTYTLTVATKFEGENYAVLSMFASSDFSTAQTARVGGETRPKTQP
jgi:hypothetical protein